MSNTYPRRRFLEMGVASGAGLLGCAPARVAQTPHVERLGGQIQHFVVLMMENRSHDQMLGAITAGPPPGTTLTYRSASGDAQAVELRYGTPRDQFYPDPPHRLAKVRQQIYGAGFDADADMGGFAQVFADEHALVPSRAASVQDYATHYADGALPILQTLAKEYGVCTRWFSAMPGSTTPNRMFTHAGTSGGATAQGAFYSRIRGRMIFDALGNDRSLWRVYFHDAPHLWLTGDAWVRAFGGQQRRIGSFARDVQNDELPVYTFIEPQHVLPPWNSQHPFMGVSHGEELIARVYNELIASPRVFEKTLLLIVYDEHGGFYDHVVPPGHPGSALDHRVVIPSAPSPEGFRFDRLGPRVPAVVVSPWIARGSRFDATFDHTSILATVSAMTGCTVESPRARAATNLTSTINLAAPRADASRLTYRASDYLRGPGHAIPQETGGVSSELEQAWLEQHGEPAVPERMVAHYASLLEG